MSGGLGVREAEGEEFAFPKTSGVWTTFHFGVRLKYLIIIHLPIYFCWVIRSVIFYRSKTLANAGIHPEPCTLWTGSVVATGYLQSEYGAIILASYFLWSRGWLKHPLSQLDGQHQHFCLEDLLLVNSKCTYRGWACGRNKEPGFCAYYKTETWQDVWKVSCKWIYKPAWPVVKVLMSFDDDVLDEMLIGLEANLSDLLLCFGSNIHTCKSSSFLKLCNYTLTSVLLKSASMFHSSLKCPAPWWCASEDYS